MTPAGNRCYARTAAPPTQWLLPSRAVESALRPAFGAADWTLPLWGPPRCRYEDYDAAHLVDCYLNLPEVKQALGADPSVTFESCSDAVGEALGPDVMLSVKHLVPDLLAAGLPLLLYQGGYMSLAVFVFFLGGAFAMHSRGR